MKVGIIPQDRGDAFFGEAGELFRRPVIGINDHR